MKNNEKFEVCARVVIIKEGKLLACKNKKKNYYFFPGGHIEYGETAEVALKREIKEELGIKIGSIYYLGTVENIYTEDKKKHHEIDIVFKASVKKLVSASQEEHINFDLIDIKKEKIYPLALRSALIQWAKDGKIFWASQK